MLDTSYIGEFYHAEKDINNYYDLISFMMDFDKEIYSRMRVEIDDHYIIPSIECLYNEKKQTSDMIWLPIGLHFKAHYLRAKEAEDDFEMRANYNLAVRIISPYKELIHIYSSQYKEAGLYYDKWFFRKFPYRIRYGEEKGELVKQRIAVSMSHLLQETIDSRNAEIAKYAAQRPISHNVNISRGKMKKVFHLNSRKVYENAQAAADDSNCASLNIIRRICQGKMKEWNGNIWQYID